MGELNLPFAKQKRFCCAPGLSVVASWHPRPPHPASWGPLHPPRPAHAQAPHSRPLLLPQARSRWTRCTTLPSGTLSAATTRQPPSTCTTTAACPPTRSAPCPPCGARSPPTSCCRCAPAACACQDAPGVGPRWQAASGMRPRPLPLEPPLRAPLAVRPPPPHPATAVLSCPEAAARNARCGAAPFGCPGPGPLPPPQLPYPCSALPPLPAFAGPRPTPATPAGVWPCHGRYPEAQGDD